MDDAVRDATMMGAAVIRPVLSQYVDVKVSVATRVETLERWQRVALAAVKQCRRATIPRIDPPRPFQDALAEAPAPRCLFVEPSAQPDARPLRAIAVDEGWTTATVILGPEGGWHAGEITAALDAGCIPVTLGPLTLRAEAMAVASLAALIAVAER